MNTAIRTTTARDAEDPATLATRLPFRPFPPPPTRRQELRRAAAVQAAWLADLR